ncbi:MAG: sigma factor, partial [Verrucomicrobiota bacterium]
MSSMRTWMTPSNPDPYEEEIESVQSRLRALVFSMTGRREDVSDIVQETNHVLWRKREQFEEGTNFWAWASKIAFFQVMAHRKKRLRDRHVFGDELVHTIADEAARALAQSLLRDHREASEEDLLRIAFERIMNRSSTQSCPSSWRFAVRKPIKGL